MSTQLVRVSTWRMTCDRCRAVSAEVEMQMPDGWIKVEVSTRLGVRSSHDLCPKCSTELLTWWPVVAEEER